jgi:ElaB/YqjD/DUF883 family membrane-anchored ribosome-binding protein
LQGERDMLSLQLRANQYELLHIGHELSSIRQKELWLSLDGGGGEDKEELDTAISTLEAELEALRVEITAKDEQMAQITQSTEKMLSAADEKSDKKVLEAEQNFRAQLDEIQRQFDEMQVAAQEQQKKLKGQLLAVTTKFTSALKTPVASGGTKEPT